MAKEEKNEFDDLQVEDGVPAQEFSPTPGQADIISSGSAGIVYDWHNAPEGVKAPPRKDLDGKIVTIKKADIIMPPEDKPWEKTRAGDKEYKYCTFILYYDVDGQQEFYAGVRVFKRLEGDKIKYSHPTITRDRGNQSSRLLGIYSDFKGKDINEVALREFLAFLNSQPKVRIRCEEVRNPTSGETIRKNLVGEFIK